MSTQMVKKQPHFKRPAGHGEQQYIDLGAMSFDDEVSGMHTGSTIKIAEIYRYEDLKNLTKLLYNGHSLMIDYSSMANDDLAMKRVSAELHSVAADVNGDVAGIGKNFIIVTSNGIKVDRNKIRGSY